ncbi:MAG TPA: hypothetical protein VF604_17355 [Pyrinomonadaceae bacterium]|jgi:hypothetical protein
MKHLKKFLVAAFLGFLAFAPPGTLIFIGVLILGFLGKTWFIAGTVTGLILLSVYALVYREKLLRAGFVKNTLRRFKK